MKLNRLLSPLLNESTSLFEIILRTKKALQAATYFCVFQASLGLAIFGGSDVAAAKAADGASGKNSELKLALNWKPEPQFGGFYEAAFTQKFEKAGLKVTVLEGGSGTPTIQMVSAGTVEYGIISADELILSYDRGSKDLVALFAVYQTNPQAIMTHQERNYANLEALLNDSEGTLLWQSGLPYAQYLLKKFAKTKVKQAPYQGGIGPFLADKKIAQQCFFTSEPLSAEKKGAKPKTFLVADAGYNPYTTVLVTKKSRLTANKDEVAKLVQAVREGWKAYLANPSPTNEKMTKQNPSMDLESMKLSAKAQLALIETTETKKNGLGWMSAERWSTLADQLVDLGVVKTKTPPQDLFQNF